MRIARLIIVAAVWAASLVGVGLWAQGGAVANAQQALTPPPEKARLWFGPGPIFTGDNLGFIPTPSTTPLTPDKDGKIAGTFVVRIDGKWVDIAPATPVR
jgi:hypothetical protein